MWLRFGRYAGMTTEALVLRRPDYVVWMLREAPDGGVGRDFTGLIERFDAKVRDAEGRPSCVAAPNQHALVIADPGEMETLVRCGLSRVNGFWDAVGHVERTVVRGRRQALRRLVRNLAIVRGMRRRFTDRAALDFLCTGGSSARPGSPGGARAAAD
jgi:hypothetical protein